MITLNEVTKRIDNSTFDTYRIKDLVLTVYEMTEDEKKGLIERLEYLENNDINDDEFEEKLVLRTLFA